MFKKFLASLLIIAEIFAAPVSAAPAGRYVRTGYIEDVDRAGNFTVLVTRDGNVWFWDGTTYRTKTGRKTLPVGAKICAVFDGQGTKNPKDDVLIDFEIYL